MSAVVRVVETRELAHLVQTNDGEFHYVDSNNTRDCGYETMAFSCDENLEDVDWGGEYCENYSTHSAMVKRHQYIITHLEEVLK